MDTLDRDTAVRLTAFAFLEEQVKVHGDLLPKSILLAGFKFEGERVPLMCPAGIFKPKVLDRFPLTFTTVPPKLNVPAPYADDIGRMGLSATGIVEPIPTTLIMLAWVTPGNTRFL